MAVDWKSIFDEYGTKTVTHTDKSKSAYVPNREQKGAVESSGHPPSQERPAEPFTITVLSDPSRTSVQASYYYSVRSEEAGRDPEPRIGREFISSWLEEGDEVLIGRIGSEIYALKLVVAPATDEEAISEVLKKGSKESVIRKAKAATGKPAKRSVTRNDFVRNPWVVAGALQRAGGKCEMPGCACDLFKKDDDTNYLEVHHVIPLADDGDDTLANAAAICPRCHRLLHRGKDRKVWQKQLAAHILTIPV